MGWKNVFLLCFCLATASINDQCSRKDGQCVDTNRYSKDHNEYFKEIEIALASFKPCNQTACNCHSSTITEDLKPFKSGITREMISAVAERGTRYQIKDHKLYRQKSCMFPSRCAGVEHFIKESLKYLPDMELILNCRDWPQINSGWGVGGPVFSFSKTAEYADIMYPTWSFWEGGPAISLYPTGLGRWDQHRASISAAAKRWPWVDKSELAFFRGSRTSAERDSLVLLSRDRPDVADASYTKNQAWKSPADTLNAEPAPEISLEDHCKYKFLFNFRGVAASFRFKHLFLCRSLVFHVGDEWQEFFYASMRPWVHYVPVKKDPSREELQSLIEFFRQNDELANAIAERGFQHIWETLDMAQVQCYWRRLLRRYAKLLRFEIVLDKDLIAV